MSIHVVAAIITKGDQILITRRDRHKSLAGFWEFPGGKVEEGEKAELALVREIEEELGVQIEVDSFYMTTEHEYDFGTIRLDSYICNLIGEYDAIESTDHDLIQWVWVDQLKEFEFAPADIEFVARLESYDQ